MALVAAVFRGFPAEAFEALRRAGGRQQPGVLGRPPSGVRRRRACADGRAARRAQRRVRPPQTVFRPHRDVRFSKDKRPYKEHQGGFIGAEDAIGWYVEVSAAGLMVAGGWYAAQGTQVPRYRDAVSSAAGAELERIVGQVRRARLEVGGDRLGPGPAGSVPTIPGSTCCGTARSPARGATARRPGSRPAPRCSGCARTGAGWRSSSSGSPTTSDPPTTGRRPSPGRPRPAGGS